MGASKSFCSPFAQADSLIASLGERRHLDLMASPGTAGRSRGFTSLADLDARSERPKCNPGVPELSLGYGDWRARLQELYSRQAPCE